MMRASRSAVRAAFLRSSSPPSAAIAARSSSGARGVLSSAPPSATASARIPIASIGTVAGGIGIGQQHQQRFKSTAPLDDDDDEAALDATLAAADPSLESPAAAAESSASEESEETREGESISSNTLSTVPDYTSDKSKSGTPSPWAVFDAWGAGADIVDALSDAEEHKLSRESVAIPFSEEERSVLPGERSSESSSSESETKEGESISSNTLSTVADYTSDKTKSGTPSPWAVFDAWGAGADIVDALSDAEEHKLSRESVAIPFTEEERSVLPGESDILEAYDH
eukprot:CAMPEP_0178648784 /NCGR_PEP_ID=MMETSP0698-20121128/20652_1 /TAXON_ID=265572 /ORGANISM="Extubocellulus spinifer, Strain CCMP396" /LENGTH=284 /DNA_ID=CAMNT_0020290149 /DNA_START=182 /DNA_END=1033 /DNA_ORIENTATION=-